MKILIGMIPGGRAGNNYNEYSIDIPRYSSIEEIDEYLCNLKIDISDSDCEHKELYKILNCSDEELKNCIIIYDDYFGEGVVGLMPATNKLEETKTKLKAEVLDFYLNN